MEVNLGELDMVSEKLELAYMKPMMRAGLTAWPEKTAHAYATTRILEGWVCLLQAGPCPSYFYLFGHIRAPKPMINALLSVGRPCPIMGQGRTILAHWSKEKYAGHAVAQAFLASDF